ncbi:S-adenosyl-L-methionine-dependent methyltransferase [Microthyrium microscopicum]|uniref:S-adenosyl-L-methionine-dependent methyltransferase n=1 Tax=Microthyrium microscopicum TaxID=703497 RepID=A0A6A6U5K4_9PEZI|nr:S-adenosyl-L-methionine-dependent methyltransferase [Microthyrium microscopicum]
MSAPPTEPEATPATRSGYTGNEIQPDEFVGTLLLVDSAAASEADLNDGDSAFGDGLSSSSSSLSSDVTDFREFNNRRYHAFQENQYWLPNDDEEISRLELQHIVWRLCLNGRLHIAPVPADVHRVIDLGTGTGKWAIEFADMHPSAEVIGTDLSPIQPNSLPSNCSFIVDNVEEEWVYSEPFDYIHSRMLCLGIHDWKKYFQQCWDNLKPGGWMEVQETKFPLMSADGKGPSESAFLQWSQYIKEAAANDGIDADPTQRFRGMLEDIGFIDIREQPLQWPIGGWPKGEREKIIGRIMIDNLRQFYKPSAMALYTKRLGWTVEQVEEFLPSVLKDLEDRTQHYYVQMHIVAARKPDIESS